MAIDYTEKVLEYFRNPRNMGRIENPDGTGKVGNPICGDVMHIYIKVKDNRIEDIKFETFGCGAAIATSSVVTELAKGKTLEDAEKISNKEVVAFLGGLPPIKKHCSLLAEEGLKAAIKDYRERTKVLPPKQETQQESPSPFPSPSNRFPPTYLPPPPGGRMKGGGV